MPHLRTPQAGATEEAKGATIQMSTAHLQFPTSPAPPQPVPVTTVTYPPFVDTPTDAQLMGPNGFICLVNTSELCSAADAQAIANMVAPLFPGKTVSIFDASVTANSAYYIVYKVDTRRQWVLLVNGVSPGAPAGTTNAYMWPTYIKTLMLQSYAQGVGAPGSFIYAPAPGEPANDPTFQWIPTPQVVAAPVAAPITLADVQSLITAYNSQAGVAPVALAG